MYPSAEALPRPSQATKITLFEGIDNAIKLTLLFLSKIPQWVFEGF